MKTIGIALCLAFVMACGGSPAQPPVNPVGTWAMTDTLKSGSCGTSTPPATTLTVAGSGGFYSMQESGTSYGMTATYCASEYCELQGTLNGVTRDLLFYADGTAAGNKSVAGCSAVFTTTGTRR